MTERLKKDTADDSDLFWRKKLQMNQSAAK